MNSMQASQLYNYYEKNYFSRNVDFNFKTLFSFNQLTIIDTINKCAELYSSICAVIIYKLILYV